MSYVHKSKAPGFRLEPRTIIIVGWIALCVALFVYVIRTPELFGSHTKEVITKEVIIQPTSNGEVTADVLVPKDRIAPGKKLTNEMFTVETRVIDGIESQVIKNISDINGAYSASVIAAKAPLLRDYISYAPPANAVTERIPAGFRAMTISVDAESGVEGWVRPGVRVDVVWTSVHRNKPTVNTIVENVEVLSAQRSTDTQAVSDKDSPIPSHITLAVSADDANRIQLAKASGALSLVLRGAGDDSLNPSKASLNVDKLLQNDRDEDSANSAGWIEVDGKKIKIQNDKRFELGNSGEKP